MSYQVLARKWRPRVFREMQGQEHVLKALINALDHDRLHHAYLFTGTRGVGKTSIARILAKCLNCEVGVSSEPCGECSACQEISQGRFVDLIEVDGASRTKVEDTRELLDNVQYAPTRGRFKIYLIDEVHMLSNHSFNALLKTLEEPPEHVKFLLATTDPQKLPVTILSRCLQFNLKNLSAEKIVEHLDSILIKESVPFDEAALWLLARSADGSMRDALSLTDQGIAFGGGKIGESDISAMLGTIDHKLIEQLMRGLINSDGSEILDAVSIFAEHAPDFDVALSDLITLLHRIAIAQAMPDALDNSYGDRIHILEFAAALSTEDVQLFYQTALIGRRDLSLSPSARAGFEMTLLRMLAFKPQGVADVPTKPLVELTQNNTGRLKPSSESELNNVQENNEGADTEKKRQPAEQKIKFEEEQLSRLQKPDVLTTNTNSTYTSSVPHEEISNSHRDKSDYAPDGHSVDDNIENIPSKVSAPLPSDSESYHAYINEMNHAQVDTAQNAESIHETSDVIKSKPVGQTKQAAVNNTDKHHIIDSKFKSTEHLKNQSVAQTIQQKLRDDVKSIVGKEGITEPLNSALSKANPSVSNADTAGPLSVDDVELDKVSLDSITPENWPMIYPSLGIKGLLQSTASNTIFVGRQENQIDFALDEAKASLFDESHSVRFSDYLSDYFKTPIRAHIHLQPLDNSLETPASYAERIRIEKQAHAVATLTTDSVVQTLQNEFGATLHEHSIAVKNNT